MVEALVRIRCFRPARRRFNPLPLVIKRAQGFAKSRVERDLRVGPQAAPQLVVIYGAGHHSANNQQKIKPAIMEMLESTFPSHLTLLENWNGITGRANPGCCTIFYSAEAAAASKLAAANDRANAPGSLPEEPAEPRAGSCRCSIM